MVRVQVSLEISITHLVKVFEFTKVFILFLNCIIRQMNKFVVYSIQIVFPRAGSDIAIFVEIALKFLVYAGHQWEDSEVKFSFVNEQRIIDVLLNDVGCITTIFRFATTYQPFDFVNVPRYTDANTSVCVLTRFDNPVVQWTSMFFLYSSNISILVFFKPVQIIFTLTVINRSKLLLIWNFLKDLLFLCLLVFQISWRHFVWLSLMLLVIWLYVFSNFWNSASPAFLARYVKGKIVNGSIPQAL